MFEWDEAKNASNRLKHGISFEEAVLIFSSPIVSWPDNRRNYGESRIISIGLIQTVVTVVVVHTGRSGRIRVISARLASRRERRIYDEHFKEAP